MLIKTYMHTDYLSARARWLISRQQRRKRKRQKGDLSILHKGSCDHHPRHSAEETACDIRHFLFVPMHSFHQIKLRWSCSLYNTDCVGLLMLACLSLLTVKLQIKAFSVVDWKSDISRKAPFQRCYISHSEVRYWQCCQQVTQTDTLSVGQPCVGGAAFPKLFSRSADKITGQAAYIKTPEPAA